MQSIDIYINFFKHLKYYFRNNKIICICNSINVNMFNYCVVRSLNYINYFNLFKLK